MVPSPIHCIIGASTELTVIMYDLYVLWMDKQQWFRYLISKYNHKSIHCA
jgi:hypothetical protein